MIERISVPNINRLTVPYSPLKQLKQLYYNLIYSYLPYAIIAWGSACTSHLKKIQVKQNHIIRLMFFATPFTELSRPTYSRERFYISFSLVLPPMA